MQLVLVVLMLVVLVLVTNLYPQCLIQLWEGMMVVTLTQLDLQLPGGQVGHRLMTVA